MQHGLHLVALTKTHIWQEKSARSYRESIYRNNGVISKAIVRTCRLRAGICEAFLKQWSHLAYLNTLRKK